MAYELTQLNVSLTPKGAVENGVGHVDRRQGSQGSVFNRRNCESTAIASVVTY